MYKCIAVFPSTSTSSATTSSHSARDPRPPLATLVAISAPLFRLFVGPQPMGSTTTEVGTLQIVHALSAMAKWGLEDFSQWFESEVMGSLREGGEK
jgi:hypothetical protein